MKGKVYLVGAGPGDPDLLTVKALRLIRTAEIILHDDLVSQGIRALFPYSAHVWNVGKRCGAFGTTQKQIHKLLISGAREGRRVVRLKGGDPLVFGRAGEEIEVLREEGIEFEVVPGITAALSAAALAGISLTDRRVASRIVFLSNHGCREQSSSDWKDFVSNRTTVVIYMPGTDYERLTERLLTAGLFPETPCLLVSCGSSPRQQIHWTNLEDLRRAPRLAAPVLIVIGAVVGHQSGEEGKAISSENQFSSSG